MLNGWDRRLDRGFDNRVRFPGYSCRFQLRYLGLRGEGRFWRLMVWMGEVWMRHMGMGQVRMRHMGVGKVEPMRF